MERQRRWTAVTLAAVWLLGAAAAVEAVGWCPLSVRACGVPGLPSSVVEGIIHVESSGRPWAIGVGLGARHRSLYPATRFQARVVLRLLLGYRERANVGVGLMQVNWLWWGDRLEAMGIGALDLLDPHTNLRAGCLVLREALTGTSGSLEARLGRYHSWRKESGRRYAERVLAEAWRLERQAGRGRIFAQQLKHLRKRLASGA